MSAARRDHRDRSTSRPAVTLFMQCLSDRLAPDIVTAAVDVLRHLGFSVDVPPAQHCCGLPALDSGDWDTARTLARSTIEVLERCEGHIVTPATSCLIAVTSEFPHLFRDEPEWLARGAAVAERLHDLSDFLTGPASSAASGAFTRGGADHVAVHRFCQGANVIGRGDRLERLLRILCDVDVAPLAEPETCCGFGGSTSFSAPEVAAGILGRKLSCIDESRATIVVTENPGCVVHLRGGVHATRRHVEVLHLAEFLRRRIPSTSTTARDQRSTP